MKIYLLGKDSLCNRLHEDASSGMALFDLMNRMSGFLTLAGNSFIFTTQIKSSALVPVKSPLPSTYAYRLLGKSKAALRVTQALRCWMELEAELKETFKLDSEDIVMYMSKMNNQIFVKSKVNHVHLERVDDEEFMRSVRAADFEAEILSVLDSLYETYLSQDGFDKILTSTRIKSLLATLESNGCGVPEKFWGFSSD